jgi:murein DD-endopeptidase MepM/ murein hydrolase activator NlpD
MIRFLIFFLFSVSLFASSVENFRWSNGETYLTFLEKQKLPTKSLYYNIDPDEQQLTEDIISGVNCQLLRDKNDKILQILIPLNDELQIHIYNMDDNYYFETIPIISEMRVEAFTLQIENSPYLDIIKETGSKKLATIFVSAFKQSLNFSSNLKKGDTLAMVYEQKYRLGKPFSMPNLHVAMIEMKNKKNYIYLSEDGRYYNEDGTEVESFLLATPVRGARISSRFTKSRFHPVLKKYRAHQGVDYAAGSGTPIMAAGDGKIAFVGFSSGYGNLIKIQHTEGLLTLYAHQKSFRKGVRSGVAVKKGDVIGYVGSTGVSTGPHLHFGLYKDGTAIDPLSVVQVTRQKLSAKELAAFAKMKEKHNESIRVHLEKGTKFIKMPEAEQECYFNDISNSG